MPFGPQGAIRDDDERDKVVSGLPVPRFATAENVCRASGKGQIALLHKHVETVTGRPFPVRRQAIGDCVSFGWATGVDCVKAAEIVAGEREAWETLTATEPIYALSRVEIGRGQLGDSDGSVGAWAAKAVNQFGVLLRQQYGRHDLTRYSGDRAKEWGNRGYGLPDELEPEAREHPVKTVSLITSYEDARDAIFNGYPVTVCSNQGFDDKRDKYGFASPSGTWAHCMVFIGMDDQFKRPGLLCMNSWGPDWISGPKRHGQPDGSFWVDAKVADKMLSDWQDSYSLSGFVGYPKRDFSWLNAWSAI